MTNTFAKLRIDFISEAVTDQAAAADQVIGNMAPVVALKGALDNALDVVINQLGAAPVRETTKMLIAAATQIQRKGASVASSPDAGNALGWAQRDVLVRVLVPNIYVTLVKMARASADARGPMVEQVSTLIQQAQEKLQSLAV